MKDDENFEKRKAVAGRQRDFSKLEKTCVRLQKSISQADKAVTRLEKTIATSGRRTEHLLRKLNSRHAPQK